MTTDSNGNGNSHDIKADVTAATDKITEFFSDKVDDVKDAIDDTKYHLEAKQRKFEISDQSSGIDRKIGGVKGWFDKEIVSRAEDAKEDCEKMMEETKEEFQKLTGHGDSDNNSNNNRNENDTRKVGEGDAGCGSSDFSFSNPCGLFST